MVVYENLCSFSLFLINFRTNSSSVYGLSENVRGVDPLKGRGQDRFLLQIRELFQFLQRPDPLGAVFLLCSVIFVSLIHIIHVTFVSRGVGRRMWVQGHVWKWEVRPQTVSEQILFFHHIFLSGFLECSLQRVDLSRQSSTSVCG